MTLPGRRLRRWASRVFNPLTMARLIEPMIADLQLEYARARGAGRPWRAWWIRFAGYVSCVRAVVLFGAQSAWRIVREPSGDDRRAIRQAAVLTTFFLLVVTGWFVIAPFLGVALAGSPELLPTVTSDPVEMTRLAALLIPQALPIAIPVAVMLGMSVAIGSRPLSRYVKGAMLALALCGSAAAFGVTAWGAPLANQEFRTTIAGADLPKGSAELTLGELRLNRSRVVAAARVSRIEGAQTFIARTDLQYHRRYALPAASLVLVLLLLTRRRIRSRLLLVSQGAIACGIYYAFFDVGEIGARGGWLNGLLAAWLPNLVFVALSAALAVRGRLVASGGHEVST